MELCRVYQFHLLGVRNAIFMQSNRPNIVGPLPERQVKAELKAHHY